MDKTQAVISQYDIAPIRMKKGRGVLLLETQENLYQLKEYFGPKERILVQNELTSQLARETDWQVECIVPNKDGNLFAIDPDKRVFLLLTVVNGKECDVYDQEESLLAVKKLRQLHEKMYIPKQISCQVYHLAMEVEKHSRDLLRARKFIRTRHHLSEFELELLRLFEHFWKQVEFTKGLCQDERLWKYEEIEAKKGSICHGDCQYHNILIQNDQVGFTSFEKWNYDVHSKDFYRLFRKIMEKNQWNPSLGRRLIEAYRKEQDVASEEMKLFYLRLCFPEKYWKIMNYYMNSRKSYISERNVEKCKNQVRMEELRITFLENLIVDFLEEGEYNNSIRYFR